MFFHFRLWLQAMKESLTLSNRRLHGGALRATSSLSFFFTSSVAWLTEGLRLCGHSSKHQATEQSIKGLLCVFTRVNRTPLPFVRTAPVGSRHERWGVGTNTIAAAPQFHPPRIYRRRAYRVYSRHTDCSRLTETQSAMYCVCTVAMPTEMRCSSRPEFEATFAVLRLDDCPGRGGGSWQCPALVGCPDVAAAWGELIIIGLLSTVVPSFLPSFLPSCLPFLSSPASVCVPLHCWPQDQMCCRCLHHPPRLASDAV